MSNNSTEEKSFKIKKSCNPDPSNFHVHSFEKLGKFVLVYASYPDCTNFEGNKVLLFYNVNLNKLVKQETLDPHFSTKKDAYYPIARFEPTAAGWSLARYCATSGMLPVGSKNKIGETKAHKGAIGNEL